MKRCYPVVCIACVGLSGLANANSIVLDRSPDAFLGALLLPSDSGNWANARSGQHFADSFSFASPVTLTGMGQFSGQYWGAVGQTVTIQLWQDAAGQPGALLNEFQETISLVNTDGASSASLITQKYADFTVPITLAANTVYWISMSGGTPDAFGELALLGLSAPLDGLSAQFNNNTYSGLNSVGDVSMRLYSDVPDGGVTLWMVGAGALGLAAYRRKVAA
ncbi:MAG: hypothetical protein H7A46_19815 [Verrucomicrobiales bacterium]|nr:hypothetical protein [Verrucomicrobiales bacterium]